MSRRYALFGTSGQYIVGDSDLSEFEGVARSMMQGVSLYLSRIRQDVVIATILSVSRNSRSHEVIYLEKDDWSRLSLKAIHSFYGRAVRETSRNGYEINAVGFRQFSLSHQSGQISVFKTDMNHLETFSTTSEFGQTKLDDGMSYLLGRYVAGKKPECVAENLATSIMYLIGLLNIIEGIAPTTQSYAVAGSDFTSDILIRLDSNAKCPSLESLDSTKDHILQLYKAFGKNLYQAIQKHTYHTDEEIVRSTLQKIGATEENIPAIKAFCSSENLPCPNFSRSLEAADIQVFPETYSGKTLTPHVTVTYRGAKLRVDKDYEVVSPEKKIVDTGEYSLKICGSGDFEGVVVKKWIVKPFDLTQDTTCSISGTSKKFTGKDVRIEPVVKCKHGKLKEGVEYKLVGDYQAIKPGEYLAKILGIGNFSGEVSFIWEIEGDEKKKGVFPFSLGKSNKKDIPPSSSDFALFEAEKKSEVSLGVKDVGILDESHPRYKRNEPVVSGVKTIAGVPTPKNISSFESVGSRASTFSYHFDEHMVKSLLSLIKDSEKTRHSSSDMLFYETYTTFLVDCIKKSSCFKDEVHKTSILKVVIENYNTPYKLADLDKYVKTHLPREIQDQLKVLNEAYAIYQRLLHENNPEYFRYILLRFMIEKRK